MPGAISKIGSSIGGEFKKSPLAFIGTGAGAIQNFLRSRQQNKYLEDQLNYQKFLRGLTTDPAKMSQYISGFEKPLSAGLTSAVGREAQAFGAERGLSTSPALMAEIESQALAPYQQHAQDQAISAALASLGMPSGTPQFPSGDFDLSAIIKQLLSSGEAPSVVDMTSQQHLPSVIPAPDTSTDATPPFLSPDALGGDFSLDDLLMSGAL